MKSKYITWMAINSWATSVSSVISTNTMLGSIMSTPSYSNIIATNYIGKDIIGQLGGMLYVYKTSKKADKEPKKYVSKGVILQQSAIFLENFSCFIKSNNYILPFLGTCSILKNISFISIGAVNATNMRKIANENIGEFYSQVACINTLSSTLGMLSGICIIHFIPSYNIRTFIILPILSCISYYSLQKSCS